VGKHAPLPSDPAAKVAEKKRRFAVYYKAWKRRRNQAQRERRASAYKQQREAIQAARLLNIDLCLYFEDMTTKQLYAAIRTARDWLGIVEL
jgi:isopropylmalate/homocitrate/citramalate synthase